VSMPVFLAALVAFRKAHTLAAALSLLSSWTDAFVSLVDLRAFVAGIKTATVKSIRGAVAEETIVEVRGTVADLSLVSAPQRPQKVLREKFIRYFATPARARMIANDAGVATSRIAWDQDIEHLWFNVLSEASKTGALDRLVALAREEYPAAGF